MHAKSPAKSATEGKEPTDVPGLKRKVAELQEQLQEVTNKEKADLHVFTCTHLQPLPISG